MKCGSNLANDCGGREFLVIYGTDILFVINFLDIFITDTFLVCTKYISSSVNVAETRILLEIMLSFLVLCHNTFGFPIISASNLRSS